VFVRRLQERPNSANDSKAWTTNQGHPVESEPLFLLLPDIWAMRASDLLVPSLFGVLCDCYRREAQLSGAAVGFMDAHLRL